MTTINNAVKQSTIQTVPKKEVQPKETKKGISTTTKVVVGTGLAALAAVGIYLATKGKAKNLKPQNLSEEITTITNKSEINELKTQVKELKAKIRTAYRTKLKENSIDFKSQRGPADNGAYKVLDSDQKEMRKQLADNQPIIDDFSKKVRTTIKELQKDSDYKELQKMRHKYKKEMYDKSGNFTGNYNNVRKLELINEVLYTKLNNGQKTPYFSQLGISVEEAIGIIKNKTLTNEDISKMIFAKFDKKARISLGTAQKAVSNGINAFYLQDAFIGGSNVKHAYFDAKKAKNFLNNNVVQNTKKRIRDVRVKVAQEMRSHEDVKKLKELNKQIASFQTV